MAKSDDFDLAGSTGGKLAGSGEPVRLVRNLQELVGT